jgi:SMI1-KNR4 cell-wall
MPQSSSEIRFILAAVAHDWKLLAAAASLRLVTPARAQVAVAHTERVVGSRLSESLRDLYAHTDGLIDEWGYAYVLPISELGRQNEHFRTALSDVYMSFDDVVLFGQLGNGDMLFQPRVPEGNNNVFVWDHEDDSRTWYAVDVPDALRRLAAD